MALLNVLHKVVTRYDLYNEYCKGMHHDRRYLTRTCQFQLANPLPSRINRF